MQIKFDFYNSIKYVFDSLYIENKINHETVVIIPVYKKGIEDILRITADYINKFILITKENLDIKNLNDKIEIINIPSNFKNEELLLMAKDVKEEYENSYIIDLSSNIIYEKYIVNGLCKEIFLAYKDLDKIYVPYLYGGLYNSIYKFFKLMTETKVVLINYHNEAIKPDIEYDMMVDVNYNISNNDNIIIII